ncbi:MAG: HD domain-containing protein [Muribaculaceae bacterium]|nr:HD domain-containing protein [Muribaculaceae bacterium]
MKTVLDSVHGTISIHKDFFEKVIDTAHFQRLRRIEQNSCRSVYPSARHDRFIHSLGVYYIGSRIADEIERKYKEKKIENIRDKILPSNWDQIKKTYKLACLLHDVGHSPFSHTFEEFFGREYALNRLKELLDDDKFNEDVDNSKQLPAEHELISAMVAVKIYRSRFDDVDWVLLSRMITGYRYLEENKTSTGEKELLPDGSFENTMIELIHGDIIDADGLDYVCRDVWAGGYRNYNINLNRLIRSINILKEDLINNTGETVYRYSVVYSSKALNEIETVLNVKNFQYLYVIKHHKVLLEQYYLVEAMKSCACYHCYIPTTTSNDRDNALRKICDPKIFTEVKNLPISQYKLTRPTDDDFVALMKLAPADKYIEGWFSRKFTHEPLWKSKLEYFNIFAPILGSISNGSRFNIVEFLKNDKFKKYLADRYNWDSDDIIVIEVTSKIRKLDPRKIKVSINDDNIPFSTLYHDSFSVIGSNKPFCYVYFNFKKHDMIRNPQSIGNIVEIIKNYLSEQLRKLWTPSLDSK